MTHRFNINFSDATWGEIEKVAGELNISHSEVVRESLSLLVWMKDCVQRGDDFLHLHAGDEWPMLMELPYFERLRPPQPPRNGIVNRLLAGLRRVPGVATMQGGSGRVPEGVEGSPQGRVRDLS